MRDSKLSLMNKLLKASTVIALAGTIGSGFLIDHTTYTVSDNDGKKSAVKYESTKVMEANATSNKEDNHIMHTLDSAMHTSWEENSPGGGVGEVLSYKFDSPMHIGRVLIANGDVSSKENFYKKNRIAKADVKYYNGDKLVLFQKVELGDTYTKKPHHIELEKKLDVDRIDIEITEVHQGENSDILAVSEVTFGNLERDTFEKAFKKRRENWVTPKKADEFIKTADKYADKAIQMNAVASRAEYYRMYVSRKYTYGKDFLEKLKEIYKASGASHITSKKDLMAAFDNPQRKFTIGRQENGLFVTSFAEDMALLFNDKGQLKPVDKITEAKGVEDGKYNDGVYQYEFDSELTKNIDKLGYIRTASGDTPGASSLNIPGCQTWAGEHIENSESELIFPSVDVKGLKSKAVLAEIDAKGYFEIIDPTLVGPGGEHKKVTGRFKIKKMQDRK
ncbi:NADase-type glycan-binding domain-containing protein [Streptococcus ictaluri]|uniref:Nicotine adenine dinucleotide glycohydrolase n=1 Tax=Streptococcus ictaluri 707-05 TaxID=764299 RepID=G5K2H8_9STRE|nr:N-acetylglucosamine-1-phosphate uridyltransferase [Streptococcus ictaluri]EHI69696.1 nicotine adenine dinucleotide glycohydrolase [Streptococcus ictaluri 707-05]